LDRTVLERGDRLGVRFGAVVSVTDLAQVQQRVGLGGHFSIFDRDPAGPRGGDAVVSKLFPKWHCKRLLRTDPLKALIIGGFVRGLSMRDIESLCEEAGLGKTSRATVSRVCAELYGASRRSVAARSTTSTWSCCSSTRSICRSGQAVRRRV